MPLILRPDSSHLPLDERLRDLHAAWRRAAVGRAVVRCVLVAGALAIAGLAADRVLNLAPATRVTGLVAGLLAVVAVWRSTATAGLARLRSPRATALEIERRHPQFADALASAAQFADTEPGRRTIFEQATIHRARHLWDALALDDAPHGQRGGRELFATLIVVGLLAAHATFAPAARVATLRLLDPYGDHPWPPRTAVAVDAPDVLMRGEPWDARVRLTGVVPDRVVIRIAVAGQPVVDVPFGCEPQSRGDVELPVRLDPHRVGQPFRYRVIANDGETPWRAVSVYVPPELVSLDGQPSPVLAVRFPRYTALPDAAVPAGSFLVDGLTGAAVDVRAAVDRPVVTATIGLAPDAAPLRVAAALAGLGAPDALTAVSALHQTHEVWADVPCRIESGGQRFAATWHPRLRAPYRLAFADKHGLAGAARLDARWQTDPSPTVTLDRPSVSSDALECLPTGRFALEGTADDAQDGVRSIALVSRVNDEAERPEPLFAASGPHPKRQPFGGTFPVERFRHADGSPLREGDALTVRVEARDGDDVTWNKPPGRSQEVTLRIVGPGQIEGRVQRTLSEARDAAARWRDWQKQATEAVEKAADPDKRQAVLAEAEALERQIDGQLGDPRDGLPAKLEALKRTLADNPLPDAKAAERVGQVARDVAKLGSDDLAATLAQLEALRKDDAGMKKPLASLAQSQRRVQRALDDLHEQLNADTVARELRQEAGTIAREQAALGEQLTALRDRMPAGADRNALPAAEQADLKAFEQQQDALKQRAGEWANKLDRAAQAERDALAKMQAQPDAPGLAERIAAQQKLVDALEQAKLAARGEVPLGEQLERVGQALKQNQLGAARAAQDAVGQRLQQARDRLDPPPVQAAAGAPPEALQRELQALIAKQEKLQDDADRLEKVRDPAERAAAADALAAEQGQVAEQARDLAERLRRAKQDAAADQLTRARRRMDQARQQLEAGQPAGDTQDDALDRLDEAQEQVAAGAKEAADALQRAEAASVVERLKALRERQAASATEGARVLAKAAEEGGWSRPLRASLADVGAAEATLADELRALAAKQFTEGGLERAVAEQAAEAMAAVSPLIDAVLADDAADASAVNAPLGRGTKRLDQLLALLKPAKPPKPAVEAPPPPMPMPEGGPPPEPTGPPEPPMPPLDRLKLVRELQAELAERTKALAERHPVPADWSEPVKLEHASIQREQAALRALFERWNEPPEVPDGKPAKKEGER